MPHHRATIPIVDDDATIRAVAAEALRDEGHATVAVADHADARRALLRRPVDLILADTAGPWVADPWAALEAVRATAGAAPVLIFSARVPAAFAGYAARGFAGLLAKPFDLDDLLATVRAALVGDV